MFNFLFYDIDMNNSCPLIFVLWNEAIEINFKMPVMCMQFIISAVNIDLDSEPVLLVLSKPGVKVMFTRSSRQVTTVLLAP